jgi:hypothetical protein
MKTKAILLIAAAVALLSFTVVNKETAEVSPKAAKSVDAEAIGGTSEVDPF